MPKFPEQLATIARAPSAAEAVGRFIEVAGFYQPEAVDIKTVAEMIRALLELHHKTQDALEKPTTIEFRFTGENLALLLPELFALPEKAMFRLLDDLKFNLGRNKLCRDRNGDLVLTVTPSLVILGGSLILWSADSSE